MHFGLAIESCRCVSLYFKDTGGHAINVFIYVFTFITCTASVYFISVYLPFEVDTIGMLTNIFTSLHIF